MHDLAITCNVVELVARAANRRKAHRVTFDVGKLSGVIPDAIAFCFSEVAKRGRRKETTADIREMEAWTRCDWLDTKLSTPCMLTTCSDGSLPFERLSGEELNIKTVELDEVL